MDGASGALITPPIGTSQSKETFSFRFRPIGRSERQTMASGCRPSARSSLTECCVGFVFSSPDGPMKGINGNVHEGTVFAPDLVAQLPDGFEEGQRFDVSYGAADLDDLEVGLFRFSERADPRFDLVGDMRDHLNGLPEVVAAPLLREHR